jgi:hypothetical protein
MILASATRPFQRQNILSMLAYMNPSASWLIPRFARPGIILWRKIIPPRDW